MLLEKWLNLEASSGELGDVSLVQSKLPKKLKKRRQVSSTEDGSSRYMLLTHCLSLSGLQGLVYMALFSIWSLLFSLTTIFCVKFVNKTISFFFLSFFLLHSSQFDFAESKNSSTIYSLRKHRQPISSSSKLLTNGRSNKDCLLLMNNKSIL
jgi:hypothetical protein